MFDAPVIVETPAVPTGAVHKVVRPGGWFKWALRKPSLVMLMVGGLLVQGCTQDDGVQFGTVGYVEGFYGGVAVEEPTAALVGRDVLTAGGSAVDAAVAVSLALSVTYPSAVSLGGGGICMVHDTAIGLSEVIDFVPPAGTAGPGQRAADRPSAIPTMVRGLAAMHARYGEFPWRSVVSPAERLARIGHRVSRAFASELTRAAQPLYNEPSVSAIFAPSGRLVGEGDPLIQPDLASILGQIRANGAGAFYGGQIGRRIVSGVQNAGGTLTFDELTSYTPTWRTAIIIPFGNDEVHFAPTPAAAGPMMAVMWRMLATDDRYADASPAQRLHLLAEVMKRGAADRKSWLAKGFTTSIPLEDVSDPDRVAGLMANFNASAPTRGTTLDPQNRQLIEVISGTGFVVVDRAGMAVACNLTLYNPFGTGRIAGDTGILLAAAPGLRGRNPLGLGPVIAINSANQRFKFALAAGGGPLAPAAAIQIMSDTLLAETPLGQAMAAPRMLAVDVPDTVLVEQSGGDDMAATLKSMGHPVSRVPWQGQAAAAYCPNGLSDRTENPVCSLVSDPRGAGLASFSSESN